ncbi:MAG: hypothetical protein LUQ11_15870, partial [Methylococcaceae bacterium]|nr:hypothetical protein [Methylococcaceae bacterium]
RSSSRRTEHRSLDGDGPDSHHEPPAERLASGDAAEPESDEPVAKIAYYPKTREGKAICAKRKCRVESVFVITKQGNGILPVLTTWFRGSGVQPEMDAFPGNDHLIPERGLRMQWPDWLRPNEHSRRCRTHGKQIRRSH